MKTLVAVVLALSPANNIPQTFVTSMVPVSNHHHHHTAANTTLTLPPQLKVPPAIKVQIKTRRKLTAKQSGRKIDKIGREIGMAGGVPRSLTISPNQGSLPTMAGLALIRNNNHHGRPAEIGKMVGCQQESVASMYRTGPPRGRSGITLKNQKGIASIIEVAAVSAHRRMKETVATWN